MTRGSFYILLQGSVQYVAYFLAYVALTRILTPSEIGELPLLSATYTVFSGITSFSLDTATTKYVAQYAGVGNADRVTGVTMLAVKTTAALSVPSFLVMALFSTQITRLIFGTALSPAVLILVIFAGVIVNFGTLLVAFLWGLNLFREMVTANIVGVLTSRLIGVLLAASFLHLEGYFIGWIIGNTFTLLIALAYSRSHLTKTEDKMPVLTMLVYSYPVMVSALLGLVQQWADVAILYGLTRSLVYTGAYFLGLAAGSILSPVANSISNATFPTLSSSHGRADRESFRNTLQIGERALNVIVFPAAFALAAIAPTAVRVAYGKTYLAATIPFAIVTVAGIFVAYQTLMVTALQSTANTQPLLKIAIVSAATEVILSASLVVPLNVVGSAVARSGMIVVSLIVTYWYVRGEWWPSLDRPQLIKCLMLSISVGVVLFWFNSYLLSHLLISPFSKLLLDTVAFGLVYLTGLVVLKPLHSEDIELLKAAIPSPLHRPLRILERRIVEN